LGYAATKYNDRFNSYAESISSSQHTSMLTGKGVAVSTPAIDFFLLAVEPVNRCLIPLSKTEKSSDK
jgi:hypothetical protein